MPSALTMPYCSLLPYAASVENSPAAGMNHDLWEMKNLNCHTEDRQTLHRIDLETASMKGAEKAAWVW